VDRAANTCKLPFGPNGGVTLPLSPFFGVMGVAPPMEWGQISTKEPRAHGGNLDNKELVEGTTLWLPVHAPGALFSAGDGHGVQGDGEVCVTALEMCLNGHFRFTLHKGGGAKNPVLRFPRAETPTHYISMGIHEDLDLAMKQALREMIAFISARANISPADAYQFCSLAVDFHVTQTVNGEKGVHGMLKKGLLI
jgi:acetamidase/formamidase